MAQVSEKLATVSKPLQFYINGEWVDPVSPQTLEVINPATEEPIGEISMGGAADVDRAVAAAKAAFETYSRWTTQQRVELLEKILAGMQSRIDELAETISAEMGAPGWLAKHAQAPAPMQHFKVALEMLKNYQFSEQQGNTLLVKEPVGVCGLITPWNWPLNQIACKVAPALAAGCTMVLKPSEVAPYDAMVFAEILHDAGVPPGVFNLVNGDGPSVGAAIASHPDVDMVSFTGSTRAGKDVARRAAETVKRVSQELGGKSANIILEDADVADAVKRGVQQCYLNSGQSCNSPTRMFVPASRHEEALQAAKQVAEAVPVGPQEADVTPDGKPILWIGPVVSDRQFQRIQDLVQKGIDEGAQLVTGGTGKPAGLETGYYVKPTVFGGVTNDMTIAREEIFGPVLSILPYNSEEEAIEMANDTIYGLSGYVESGSREHAVDVARQIRSGQVHINGAPVDFTAPFGGYKQSGNGREWGEEGFEEFLEIKAVMGGAE